MIQAAHAGVTTEIQDPELAGDGRWHLVIPGASIVLAMDLGGRGTKEQDQEDEGGRHGDHVVANVL